MQPAVSVPLDGGHDLSAAFSGAADVGVGRALVASPSQAVGLQSAGPTRQYVEPSAAELYAYHRYCCSGMEGEPLPLNGEGCQLPWEGGVHCHWIGSLTSIGF